MRSLEEQLESVQAAIEAIEQRGQSYLIETGGIKRSLTRADLKSLYTREAELKRQITRNFRGSISRVVF